MVVLLQITLFFLKTDSGSRQICCFEFFRMLLSAFWNGERRQSPFPSTSLPSPLLALPSVVCYHYYIFVFFFSGKFVKSVPMKLVKEVQQCFFVCVFLPSFFPSVCGFLSLFLSLSVWLSLSHSLSQMLQPESSIKSRIMKSLLQMPFQLHISKSRVFVSALERHTHW